MIKIDNYLAAVHNDYANIPLEHLSIVLDILHSRYSESHRYYHTVDHILDLITLYDKYEDQICDKNCLILSILFHDVIYETNENSSDNEFNSAELFEKLYRQYIPSEIIDKVKSYILHTKSHDVFDINDDDLKLFIDMDLSILGRDYDQYLVYSKNIRNEYIHIDKNTYCRKRAEALNQFLVKTTYIYSSNIFRTIYEVNAKRNIAKEISLLQSDGIE